MKIVQLTDNYLPSIGGTERHVARLSAALTARGHEVVVVTMPRPGHPTTIVDDSHVSVVRPPILEAAALRVAASSSGTFHPPFPLPGAAIALARYIRTLQPDVIHGHNWMTYSLLTSRRTAPIVHTLHDYGAVCPKMTLLRPDNSTCTLWDGQQPSRRTCTQCSAAKYSRPTAAVLTHGLRAATHLHSRIDKVLAVSEPVARQQQGVFSSPIEVVPTFIADNLDDIVASQPRPDFLPHGPFMLFVGALSPHKGLSLLLSAHERLGPSAPPLVLCGVRKPDTPPITSPNVHVFEDVPHPLIMAAWREATVGVVPSVWAEPWGQVAAEALTARCPLVVSQSVGLAPQIEAAGAGIVVPPNDVDALTSALRRVVDNPDAHRDMTHNGRILAESLTISRVVPRLEEIYKDLIESHQAPSRKA